MGPATAWTFPRFFPHFFLPHRSLPREGRVPAALPPLTRAQSDKLKIEKQLQTVDRSAPASMKNAANCVNQCELQDTLIIDVSNAHGGPGSLPGPRPVEGRFLPLRNFAVFRVSDGSPCLCARGRFRNRLSRTRVLSPSLFRISAGSWRSVLAVRLTGPVCGVWRVRRSSPSSTSFTRPQLGRDDPLNLSILLRGGKENNDDSLSKGD